MNERPNHRVTISVAMCTYNGEAFVEAQLRSIAGQSRPPDELVVRDDGSLDETARIVTSFARTAPFPVRLRVNDHRIGSTDNFAKAIAECDGDLIALADQDDVWHPDKLAVQARVMRSERLDAIFADADVVGSDRSRAGYTMWDALGFGERERALVRAGKGVSMLLRMDVVTGATLMFRSGLRDAILPFPEGWVHDAWIALVAAAVGKLGFVDAPLIEYRQHAGNQIGAAKRRSRRARFLHAVTRSGRGEAGVFSSQLERYATGSKRLREMSPRLIDPGVLADVAAKTAHVGRRGTLPMARLRRVPVVVAELAGGRYHRYSGGWRSAGKDLLLR